MDSKKTALVTGSSSGIGLGIAKSLLQRGYKVVIHGIETALELEPLVKELQAIGEVVGYFQVDMGDAEAIEKFCNHLKTAKINIDILVNNAGIQHVAPIQDFSSQKWDQIIAINLSSAFHLMRQLVPYMQSKRWGRITNIASAHGLVASANKSAYVASKHASVGLTKVVALENAKIGVTCNAICPGWVYTPLVEAQVQKKAVEQSISVEQAKINLLVEKQPSEQFVNTQDIGEFVLFLCSLAANQINGASLSIDGGWVAQ